MAITVNNGQSVSGFETTITLASYNVGAGTAGERKLVVYVQTERSPQRTVTSVEYGGAGGTDLTSADSVSTGNNFGEIWFLDDTGIGSGSQTKDILVTLSGNADVIVIAAWLDGVSQGVPTQTVTAGNTGSGFTAFDATINSVAANAIVINGGGLGDARTMTEDGAQTLLLSITTATVSGSLAHEIPGSGNHTQGWTFSSARRPNIILAEWAEFFSGNTLTADKQSYILSGKVAGLDVGITATKQTYTLTGNAAGLSKGSNLTADTQTYTLTGNVTGLDVGLTAAQQNYTLIGNASGLDVTLPAVQVSYTLTGIDAGLNFSGAGNTLTADTQTYILTGTVTGLDVGLPATQQSYTLTGNTAGLDVGLGAVQASYALTGTTTGLDVGLPAVQASYVLTGIAAGLSKGSTLAADTQSYTLTGISVGFGVGLTASAQTYVLTGNDAGLYAGNLLVATTQSYILTGIDAAISVYVELQAETRGYTLVGLDVSFTVDSTEFLSFYAEHSEAEGNDSGFYDDDPKDTGDDLGFYNTHPNDPGDDGGFYN